LSPTLFRLRICGSVVYCPRVDGKFRLDAEPDDARRRVSRNNLSCSELRERQ
jgi:hypothetical protein